MSSIVSRRPPLSVSTSQENDFFWMSMRFGTSRTLSSRAKLRRVRGASTEAKTATPLGGRGGGGKVRGSCPGHGGQHKHYSGCTSSAAVACILEVQDVLRRTRAHASAPPSGGRASAGRETPRYS